MKKRVWLDWLVYGAGGVYIGLFLFTATLRLLYPYEVEWNEGAVLDHAIRVLSGKPIYAAPSLDFSAFVYTPFYYYVTALLMKIGGVGLWAGRLISTISTLFTATIAWRIVRRETSSKRLAFVSFALYLAFYHITGFFYDIVRMDAFALFLVAASIYAALYLKSGFLFAALLTTLAYFTKQQMVFILPALTVGLAFRNTRHAMWFALASISLILIGTLVCNWETNGWYRFYTLTIPGMKASENFSYITAIEFLPKWILGRLGIFAFVIVTSLIMMGRKTLRGNWPLFLTCYMLALFSSAVSIGNSGGYQNVFMPIALMTAVVFPICLHTVANSLPKWSGLAQGIAFLAFLSLLYNPLGQKMLFGSQKQRRGGDEFVARLKEIPGDVWLPFHGYIGTLAGKQTHVHFMAMNDALVPHDTTSIRFQHEIDSSLAAHRFGAIILDEEDVFHWDSVPFYKRSGMIFSAPNIFLSRIGDAGTRPDFIYMPSR